MGTAYAQPAGLIVVLIGLLLLVGFILSRPALRQALPFESLLAVGIVGVLAVALFQMGRLS